MIFGEIMSLVAMAFGAWIFISARNGPRGGWLLSRASKGGASCGALIIIAANLAWLTAQLSERLYPKAETTFLAIFGAALYPVALISGAVIVIAAFICGPSHD